MVFAFLTMREDCTIKNFTDFPRFWEKLAQMGPFHHNTKTKMLSFSLNFKHWLHWKLSFWQLPVQPMIKIESDDNISSSVWENNWKTPFYWYYSLVYCSMIAPWWFGQSMVLSWKGCDTIEMELHQQGMMMSCHGNAFLFTGPLRGESTNPCWLGQSMILCWKGCDTRI